MNLETSVQSPEWGFDAFSSFAFRSRGSDEIQRRHLFHTIQSARSLTAGSLQFAGIDDRFQAEASRRHTSRPSGRSHETSLDCFSFLQTACSGRSRYDTNTYGHRVSSHGQPRQDRGLIGAQIWLGWSGQTLSLRRRGPVPAKAGTVPSCRRQGSCGKPVAEQIQPMATVP